MKMKKRENKMETNWKQNSKKNIINKTNTWRRKNAKHNKPKVKIKKKTLMSDLGNCATLREKQRAK